MDSQKYKSTIQGLTPKPNKEYKDKVYKVTTVSLANGHNPEFWSISEFPFKKGNVIEYTLDTKNNKGKLSFPHPNFEENKEKMIDTNGKKISSSQMTQQESIARSVAWNNVSQFVFTEEFQKHGLEPYTKDEDGNTIILSKQQLYMIDQASFCADIIYKRLITKPK